MASPYFGHIAQGGYIGRGHSHTTNGRRSECQVHTDIVVDEGREHGRLIGIIATDGSAGHVSSGALTNNEKNTVAQDGSIVTKA